MTPVVVIDVVGLTPRLLAHMPNVSAVGAAATLRPVLPAVTCSMQATLLTGAMPREHGIVGNGWYFRDLGEVLLWRQHNALVQGGQLWDAVPRASEDRQRLLVVRHGRGQRPARHAAPDLPRRRPQVARLLHPPPVAARRPGGALRRRSRCSTTGDRPRASPPPGGSSRPPATSCARNARASSWCYVPHLDYDLQRYGPDGPEAIAAAQEVDAALAPLLAEDADRS